MAEDKYGKIMNWDQTKTDSMIRILTAERKRVEGALDSWQTAHKEYRKKVMLKAFLREGEFQ